MLTKEQIREAKARAQEWVNSDFERMLLRIIDEGQFFPSTMTSFMFAFLNDYMESQALIEGLKLSEEETLQRAYKAEADEDKLRRMLEMALKTSANWQTRVNDLEARLAEVREEADSMVRAAKIAPETVSGVGKVDLLGDNIEKPLEGQETTLNEYQKLAMRTDQPAATELENITCAVMGLAGEAGELLDYIKKVRYQGHELDTGKLVDEAGDVLWYIAKLANALCDHSGPVMLEDIAQYNIGKLRKRYPDGFSAERSVHRNY